jgi:raffinose/stachyose/melibiose transport system substrate-binding protein
MWNKTVFILGVIVCAFASCSRDDITTVRLWHIYEDQSRGVPIAAAVQRFEAANPGIRVEITTTPNDPYKTKLSTVSKEDFPDLFHSWGGGWLKFFVDAGYVADITDDANAVMNQLNPNLVDLATFNGRVYGVPYTAGATILYYNREIFDRFNLRPPETMGDLQEICQTLVANGIIPFAEANRTMWPGAQHFVLLSMRIGGGDIFSRAQNGEVAFTDPAFVGAGDALLRMVERNWFPTGVNGIDYDTGQSRMLFYTGQAAMILQTSGFLGTCRTENRDFYDNNLALSLYPSVEGGRGMATDILAGVNAFSVGSGSRNIDLAKRLAIFLATDEQLHQDMLNNGILAAKPGINVEDRHVVAALRQLYEATYLQNYVDQTLSTELAELHKATTQALFGRTMTSMQAAESMQKAFTR